MASGSYDSSHYDSKHFVFPGQGAGVPAPSSSQYLPQQPFIAATPFDNSLEADRRLFRGFISVLKFVGLVAIIALVSATLAIAIQGRDAARRADADTPDPTPAPTSGIVYDVIIDDAGNKAVLITADVVIVGSGPAGATFGKLGTDDGTTSALILEAGFLADTDRNITDGVYNRILLSLYWDLYGHPGKSRPVPTFGGRTQEMQTGRVVGGSSAINNMNAVWPSEEMMEAYYEALGESPLFTVAAQKAALKRIETFIPISTASSARGTAGPIKVVQVPLGGPLAFATKLFQAFQNVTGLGEVSDYMLSTYGFTRTWQLFMDQNGKRSDSRTAFLNEDVVSKATQSQLNGVDGRLLQVLTGSYVTKINFDTTSGVEPIATGVSFVRNGVPHIAVARKAVVDAAGWFSPHLLQVSGIGDEDVLAAAGIPLVKHNAHVGRHCKNHLALSWTFSKPSGDVATDPDNGNFTCTAGAFYPSPVHPSDPRRGLQFVFQDGLVSGGSTADPANQPPTPNPAALVITAFLLHPDSEGTVFPKTASIFDPPTWTTNYADPSTLDFTFFINASRNYIAPVASYMASTFSGYAATNPTLATIADNTLLNAYITANIRHTHHGSGCSRMMPCDAGGVVDPETGLVCGVKKLFSCNTQTLPLQSDGNHQFPVLMFADIIARNAIANDWYAVAA